jgi:IS5 family transposase
MAKLENTSGTAIAITFLVMNLSTWLRRVFCVFFCRCPKIRSGYDLIIVKNYILANYKNKNLCFTWIELPINCDRDFS